MIQISGLTKTFGASRAIDDVTTTFPAGSVTALLGLNGAGKTTLLRMIAGLDSADRGEVLVFGRRPSGDPRLLGAHLGPSALDPGHTVWRQLRWLAALAGVDDAEVGTALDETGLRPQRHERIGGLSLGARQRVAIAAALLCRPHAMLFDEPLNGLDVPGIVWFRGLLRKLAAEGNTVVVATHMLAEVSLSADRIMVLQGGRLNTAGALADVVPSGADTRAWLESTLLECA
ncbi:MAG: ATP-binding cassette domain-containing protein [Actinomycetota bacterium]|nr:ATP-binding cassette domain-containing protein [Actinomycetota bacterium]